MLSLLELSGKEEVSVVIGVARMLLLLYVSNAKLSSGVVAKSSVFLAFISSASDVVISGLCNVSCIVYVSLVSFVGFAFGIVILVWSLPVSDSVLMGMLDG